MRPTIAMRNLQKNAWLLLLSLLFTAAALPAQAPAESVVMGYTLGAHADSIDKQHLLSMGRFQKLNRWDRQDEGLQLEGVSLQWVRLFFWENHLHSVEIKATEGHGPALYEWLVKQYGTGKKLDAMGYRYQWFAPTMRVVWDQNLATKEGVAQFVDEVTNEKYFKFMYNREHGTK